MTSTAWRPWRSQSCRSGKGVCPVEGAVAARMGPADNESMAPRARLVGFNHVALEVGDLEDALEFYGRLFEIKLRGRGPGMAFIDAGDQFIALTEEVKERPDDHRHIGMVVDDKRAVRR